MLRGAKGPPAGMRDKEPKNGHKRRPVLALEAVAAAGIGFEGKTPVMVRRTLTRGLLAALLMLSTVPLSLGVSASLGDFSALAQGATIQTIRVEGNKRVDPETIRAYLTFSPGDSYDPAQVDESL